MYVLEMSVSKPFIWLLQLIALCSSPFTLQQPPLSLGKSVVCPFQPIHPPPIPGFVINKAEPRGPGLPRLVSLTAAAGPAGCWWGWEPMCTHLCMYTSVSTRTHTYIHTHTPQICFLPPSANNKSCHGNNPRQKFWGFQFHKQPGLNQVVCPAGNVI